MSRRKWTRNTKIDAGEICSVKISWMNVLQMGSVTQKRTPGEILEDLNVLHDGKSTGE